MANPYAPPKAGVADVAPGQLAPAMWNPNAAANWCLLFSPAFGAYLHMKNWQALGEPGKAASAKAWFLVTLVTLVGLSCAMVLLPSRELLGLQRSVGFILLLAWYFGSARGQAQYVKSRFGDGYPRRGWLAPLGIALLALTALVVANSVLIAVHRAG